MTDRERLLLNMNGGGMDLGILRNLKQNGFNPTTVLDIGASIGDWTILVAEIFDKAHFHMVDAIGVEPRIKIVKAALGKRGSYDMALLGSEARPEVPFWSMGPGSSCYRENTTFERKLIMLPMRTLDDLVQERGLYGRFFLKLDVQGSELDVLAGAPRALSETDVVLMEVSLLPYNQGAPLFTEVVAWMADHGFVAYDFCALWRRQTDAALFQTDMLFVRKDSFLRTHKKFFLSEP